MVYLGHPSPRSDPKVEEWSVRRDLTIEASGPGVLIDVVRNEVKQNNWDKKSVCFLTTDPSAHEYTAAGIKVRSEYDNTWLERPTQIGPFTR